MGRANEKNHRHFLVNFDLVGVAFLFHAPEAAGRAAETGRSEPAWMLTAAVLVPFMTLPGWRCYTLGGVRASNVISFSCSALP